MKKPTDMPFPTRGGRYKFDGKTLSRGPVAPEREATPAPAPAAEEASRPSRRGERPPTAAKRPLAKPVAEKPAAKSGGSNR